MDTKQAQYSRTAQEKHQGKFNFRQFCNQLLPPQPFNLGQLLEAGASEYQVAGHSGFLTSEPAQCLKPFNIECARGRREHLFYQMVKYFLQRAEEKSQSEKLYYKDFPLFIHPDERCDCLMDPETFRSVSRHIANFKHVKHLSLQGDDFEPNSEMQIKYANKIYSDNPYCPCYGTNRSAKDKCSMDYDLEDYLCLEDLHAHCLEPCILDIKIGRITYDPMATQQKIDEQTNKYPMLRDYGFRILGMKTGLETRGKEYGKRLESQEQLSGAFESFFNPLKSSEQKVTVIGKMLDRLERLLEWFETKNNNQLRFFSSSLLFVYDSRVSSPNDDKANSDTASERLARSVRVTMIDFAHVFHSHNAPEGPSRSGSGTSICTSGSLNKDDNYLYGLRRLVKFFIMLNRQHRIRHLQHQLPP